MPNTSETWKTGEIVRQEGPYECLICRQMGARTVVTLARDQIVPFCETCGTKDGTFRLAAAAGKR